MSIIPQTYTCDADGCERKYNQDSNGWIAMNVVTGGILTASKFNADRERLVGCKHVCGYDHASQLFAKWLASGEL